MIHIMEITSKTKGSNWPALDMLSYRLLQEEQAKNSLYAGQFAVILNQGGIQNRLSKDIKTKFFDMLGQYLPEKATGNIVFHFTEGSLKQVNFNF